MNGAHILLAMLTSGINAKIGKVSASNTNIILRLSIRNVDYVDYVVKQPYIGSHI